MTLSGHRMRGWSARSTRARADAPRSKRRGAARAARVQRRQRGLGRSHGAQRAAGAPARERGCHETEAAPPARVAQRCIALALPTALQPARHGHGEPRTQQAPRCACRNSRLNRPRRSAPRSASSGRRRPCAEARCHRRQRASACCRRGDGTQRGAAGCVAATRGERQRSCCQRMRKRISIARCDGTSRSDARHTRRRACSQVRKRLRKRMRVARLASLPWCCKRRSQSHRRGSSRRARVQRRPRRQLEARARCRPTQEQAQAQTQAQAQAQVRLHTGGALPPAGPSAAPPEEPSAATGTAGEHHAGSCGEGGRKGGG
jgi:hypothetical protein